MSGALANKNPSVKAETASFMARALCYCTPANLNKKLLKVIVTDLLKGVSEPGEGDCPGLKCDVVLLNVLIFPYGVGTGHKSLPLLTVIYSLLPDTLPPHTVSGSSSLIFHLISSHLPREIFLYRIVKCVCQLIQSIPNYLLHYHLQPLLIHCRIMPFL